MNFYQWYKNSSREELNKLGDLVKRSPDYLSLVARGHRKASHSLARDLEKHTGVSKHSLRPDIFGDKPDKAA